MESSIPHFVIKSKERSITVINCLRIFILLSLMIGISTGLNAQPLFVYKGVEFTFSKESCNLAISETKSTSTISVRLNNIFFNIADNIALAKIGDSYVEHLRSENLKGTTITLQTLVINKEFNDYQILWTDNQLKKIAPELSDLLTTSGMIKHLELEKSKLKDEDYQSEFTQNMNPDEIKLLNLPFSYLSKSARIEKLLNDPNRAVQNFRNVVRLRMGVDQGLNKVEFVNSDVKEAFLRFWKSQVANSAGIGIDFNLFQGKFQ